MTDGSNALSRDAKMAGGLSREEALARLAEFGPNELAQQSQYVGLSEFLHLLVNPLILILLIASLISALLGQVFESVIVIAMVILGVAINFVQSFRSQRAVDRLRLAVTPTASVLRDGKIVEVPRRELVPGDVIQLAAGDMVPADARLLEARDLHVQEAALTGESFPVEKQIPPQGEIGPLVYLGSSVVSGAARGLVMMTGSNTLYGSIAARLATRAPETDFDRGTRRFGYLIMETVFALVIFVFLANALMHRNLMESLLFAVALAVGLTPEFLPVITAVTLARGAVKLAKSDVIVKQLSAMQNFGSIDVLCSDKTGTITSGAMILQDSIDPLGRISEPVFRLAYINSFYETGIRSPLDQAILASRNIDLSHCRKLDEVPFDFERRRLSVAVEEGGRPFLITKGAPEGLFEICTHFRAGESESIFGQKELKQFKDVFRQLSAKGMRVLAVGTRVLESSATAVTKADERDLIFEGFLAFFDPPLPGVAEVISGFHQDGVKVKILTGDSDLVTRHVCEQVGLRVGKIILGQDIERMTDSALAHVVEANDIFARVSPAHKNRIILALKSRKHVVGYMGDGINDAPSLHTADVGISFSDAVDVAREAADIILLKRDLKILHEGIMEGRKAFGNVMKYLLMGTSSNFGNMFSMAAASLFLPFLPMLPLQILLNNFLYDLAQITIPTDNVDQTYVLKPRHWDISLVRNFMIVIGPLSSLYDFLTFFILFRVFHATEALFHTGWFLESLVTQSLVIFSIRTAGNFLKSKPSMALTGTVLGVIFAGMALPYTPMAERLGFVPLPASYFLFLILMTVTYLGLVEMVKRRLMERLHV